MTCSDVLSIGLLTGGVFVSEFVSCPFRGSTQHCVNYHRYYSHYDSLLALSVDGRFHIAVVVHDD